MIKKTFWIINQYAGSPNHGMEYRHYFLAKELTRLGNKVIIISGSYSHLFKTPPTVNSKVAFETIDEIDYVWVNIPQYEKSISLGRFKNMYLFKKRLINIDISQLQKPDVIIVSSPSLFPIKIAKKWSIKLNAKLWFEIRDIWPLTLKELGGLSNYHPLVLYMQKFEKFGYKNCDLLVSLLPNAEDYFINNGLGKNKFKWLPNGVDLEGLKSDVELDNETKSLFPENKFIIGYAGTLGKANNIDTLIDAAKLLQHDNSIAICIVGKGEQMDYLKNKASELSNVIFIPPVDRNKVQAVVSLFDVAFIGLKDEALFKYGVSPNKLFEYMLASKPIIYAINSGNKPVDEANCGISIRPENANELAEAIVKMKALSLQERNKLGQNGKEHVMNYYTYNELAKKVMSWV